MNDPHWTENGHTTSAPKEWTGKIGIMWRCPSVTYGGKPYFWTGVTDKTIRDYGQSGIGIKLCWVIDGECPKGGNITFKDGFKTAKSAMNWADINI